jgi:hypothetical protein
LVFFNRRLFATLACGFEDVSNFWNIEGHALTFLIAPDAAGDGIYPSQNQGGCFCLPWRLIGARCG